MTIPTQDILLNIQACLPNELLSKIEKIEDEVILFKKYKVGFTVFIVENNTDITKHSTFNKKFKSIRNIIEALKTYFINLEKKHSILIRGAYVQKIKENIQQYNPNIDISPFKYNDDIFIPSYTMPIIDILASKTSSKDDALALFNTVRICGINMLNIESTSYILALIELKKYELKTQKTITWDKISLLFQKNSSTTIEVLSKKRKFIYSFLPDVELNIPLIIVLYKIYRNKLIKKATFPQVDLTGYKGKIINVLQINVDTYRTGIITHHILFSDENILDELSNITPSIIKKIYVKDKYV